MWEEYGASFPAISCTRGEESGVFNLPMTDGEENREDGGKGTGCSTQLVDDIEDRALTLSAHAFSHPKFHPPCAYPHISLNLSCYHSTPTKKSRGERLRHLPAGRRSVTPMHLTNASSQM